MDSKYPFMHDEMERQSCVFYSFRVKREAHTVPYYMYVFFLSERERTLAPMIVARNESNKF